jgi:hypothetical protein
MFNVNDSVIVAFWGSQDKLSIPIALNIGLAKPNTGNIRALTWRYRQTPGKIKHDHLYKAWAAGGVLATMSKVEKTKGGKPALS